MLVTDILARLRTDSSNFNTGMASASRSLGNFQAESAKTSSSLGALGSAAMAAGAIAATAVAAAGTALVGLGVKGMQGAASMEQLKISMVGIFEGTGKSAQDAYDYLSELQDFAAKTPFEFASLAETSKKLMAVGYEGDQVITMLNTMGNAAAAAGKGSDAVLRLANSFQRAKGSGRLTGETIMMISEAMPTFNARAAIANELFGGDMPAAMKALESGTLDVNLAIDAMLKGMDNLAGAEGAMERQSKTLIGIMSTFKDEVSMAMVAGLEPALPAIEEALTKLIEPVSEFTKNFGAALGPAIASFIDTAAPAIIELAKVLGPALASVIEALGPILGAVVPIVSSLVQTFGSFMQIIAGPVSDSLLKFAPLLKTVADMLGNQFLLIMNALLPVLPSLAEALVSLVTASLPLIKAMTDLNLIIILLAVPVITFIANVITLANNLKILTPILAAIVLYLGYMKIVAVLTSMFTFAEAVMASYAGSVLLAEGAVISETAASKASAIATAMQTAARIATSIATKTVTAVTWLATAAQWAWNAAMLANPVGLVILAIVALIAIIALLVVNWDTVTNAVSSAWDATYSATENAVNWISDKISGLISWFTSLPNKFFTAMSDLGGSLVDGIKKGLENFDEEIRNAIMGPFGGIIDGVKNLLGIHSPSTVMAAMGEDTMQGYINGVMQKKLDAINAAKDVADAVVAEFKNGFLNIDRTIVAQKLDEAGILNFFKKSGFSLAKVTDAFLSKDRSQLEKLIKKYEAQYEIMGESASTVVELRADDLRKLFEEMSLSASNIEEAINATATTTVVAKRLTTIIAMGKQFGKKFGQAFQDGYKTVRGVVGSAVDQLRQQAQSLLDAAYDMHQQIMDYGKLVNGQAPTGYELNAKGFIDSMQRRIEAIMEFNKALQTLGGMNLDKTVFADIAQMGPEAGLSMAKSLIEGGQSAIDQINSLQGALSGVAYQTAGVFAQGASGQNLSYLQGQAGMEVNFTKDSIKITVGAGATDEDAAKIRKAVVAGVKEAMKMAKHNERVG